MTVSYCHLHHRRHHRLCDHHSSQKGVWCRVLQEQGRLAESGNARDRKWVLRDMQAFARRILEGRSIPGRGMIWEKSMNVQEINVQETGNDLGRKPGWVDDLDRGREGRREGSENPSFPGSGQAVGKLGAWMGAPARSEPWHLSRRCQTQARWEGGQGHCPIFTADASPYVAYSSSHEELSRYIHLRIQPGKGIDENYF